jgi:acyl transferase domain-containing protein
MTMVLCKGSFLSPDGRCKSFDARANGYVRSEGAGMVVLKPLSRALADGDPIYAVIRGTAVNQDGRSEGVTVPSVDSQITAVRAALGRAGVQPGEVGYVEAHGTGTAVGDPIEARALATALSADRDAADRLVIGSVKSNFGHTESAAGVAGLIPAFPSTNTDCVCPRHWNPGRYVLAGYPALLA